MNRDQRYYRRIPICRKAWARHDAGTYRRAFTIDLNVNGAQISVDRSMAPHTILDLHVKLEDGAPLSIRAVVVWCRFDGRGRFQIGLAFPRQHSSDARQLIRWHHTCEMAA